MSEEKKNLTEEERKELKEGLKNQIDEMSDDELDKVAGGTGASDIFLENVTVTKYSYEEYGTRIFANGEKISTNHIGTTCAVSTDLKKIFPIGSKIKVNGFNGTLEVKDLCRAPNRIDIFVKTKRECINWGKKICNVTKVE